MKPITLFISPAMFLVTALSCAAMDARHQMDSLTDSLRWSKGPTTVALGQVATLEIPAGLAFLDRSQTRTLFEKLGTETSGDEVGFVASESQDWTAVIAFHEVGYVSDEGWENLDAISILEAIRTTNRGANRGRAQKGWETIRVGNWESPPAYDSGTHRIEWAVRTESAGATVVNRVVSVLGRRGVVQMILVDPHQAVSATAVFTDLVRGLAFRPGERYRDRRPGDPGVSGGLAAIVSGMNGLESVESVADPAIPAQEDRASIVGDHAWVIGSVAALAGFVVGRTIGWSRRKHRFPAGDGWRGRRSLPAVAASPASGQKTAASAGAGFVGAEGCSRGIQVGPSGEPFGKRQRRCDAYSFYERLTRDLHWTINY